MNVVVVDDDVQVVKLNNLNQISRKPPQRSCIYPFHTSLLWGSEGGWVYFG